MTRRVQFWQLAVLMTEAAGMQAAGPPQGNIDDNCLLQLLVEDAHRNASNAAEGVIAAHMAEGTGSSKPPLAAFGQVPHIDHGGKAFQTMGAAEGGQVGASTMKRPTKLKEMLSSRAHHGSGGALRKRARKTFRKLFENLGIKKAPSFHRRAHLAAHGGLALAFKCCINFDVHVGHVAMNAQTPECKTPYKEMTIPTDYPFTCSVEFLTDAIKKKNGKVDAKVTAQEVIKTLYNTPAAGKKPELTEAMKKAMKVSVGKHVKEEEKQKQLAEEKKQKLLAEENRQKEELKKQQEREKKRIAEENDRIALEKKQEEDARKQKELKRQEELKQQEEKKQKLLAEEEKQKQLAEEENRQAALKKQEEEKKQKLLAEENRQKEELKKQQEDRRKADLDNMRESEKQQADEDRKKEQKRKEEKKQKQLADKWLKQSGDLKDKCNGMKREWNYDGDCEEVVPRVEMWSAMCSRADSMGSDACAYWRDAFEHCESQFKKDGEKKECKVEMVLDEEAKGCLDAFKKEDKEKPILKPILDCYVEEGLVTNRGKSGGKFKPWLLPFLTGEPTPDYTVLKGWEKAQPARTEFVWNCENCARNWEIHNQNHNVNGDGYDPSFDPFHDR